MAELFPSWSSYSYVYNNPLNFIDPDGRSPDIINPVDDASKKAYDEYYASASPERQAELDAIDADQSVVYNISVSADHKGGETKPAGTPGVYNVNVEDVGEYTVGILADELTHVSQIESNDIGFGEDGRLGAYDLEDEVDSKNAAIEALDKKGLKMEDTPAKNGNGYLSKKYGKLHTKNGGQLTDKQIEKWSRKLNRDGDSYNKIFIKSGGSTKMGVRTKFKN